MQARFILSTLLIFFCTSVHAEYYFVTECHDCNYLIQSSSHHHKHKKHSTNKSKPLVTKKVTVKKVAIKHKASRSRATVYHCFDSYCANGHFVKGHANHDDRFEAFPHFRDKHFKRDYDNYNNDLATGDDDTYKHPDMQIN